MIFQVMMGDFPSNFPSVWISVLAGTPGPLAKGPKFDRKRALSGAE